MYIIIIFDNEWKKFLKEIQDVIFTFYLNDLDFNYKDFMQVFPWWFPSDHKKYFKRKSSNKREIILTEDLAKAVEDLYPKVMKSTLFRSEDYIVLSHHYMQIHNRDFFPDIILDAFILLEFLFSRESKENIAFQISFNAGLFLTNTQDEFLFVFKFIKKLYGIRSALIHGDRWYNKLNKVFNKFPTINNNSELIYELYKKINKSLRKLIHLMEYSPEILSDLNQINKLSSKIKIAKYLIYLGLEYKKQKDFSNALKMDIEALKIIDILTIKEKKEKINELLNEIKEIYDINEGKIIFSEELNKFEDELKTIVRLNGDLSDKAKKLLDQIEFYKFVSPKKEISKPKQEIRLAVNGNDIMNILKIKQSKEVGEIKDLIISKILRGELKNQREDIINFIKYFDKNNSY